MVSRRRYTTLREYFTVTRARYAEVADAVGVSVSAISLYVQGKRIPQPAIALRLSRITGVPLESLLDPVARRGAA